MNNVILRNLKTQGEWACACLAVSNFMHDESGKVGRRHAIRYMLDAPGESDITLEIWRSKRGIEVRRTRYYEDEIKHEMETDQ